MGVAVRLGGSFRIIGLMNCVDTYAVWYQSDGARDNIRANRFSAGSGAWGTAQAIETDNGEALRET